ncbi:serine hydrolase domain-containing protein [Aquipuribacter sp. MA13-6]|uniref:serine hydrolase domain-containing protein n=1 Tax=unclassified Aquipuribacter TaxID=2635084 RepID=UPI003EEC48F6
MNRRLTAVLTALAAATALTVVAAVTLAPRPARLDAARTGDAAVVERAVEAVGSERLNAVSVAVVRPDGEGGRTVTTGAAGRTRGDGTPVTETTAFETGSVMKPLTGHLLADLVASGDADLDRPVGDLVPGTPLAGTGAGTLGELATHRSGLPRLVMSPTELARGLLVPFGADPYTGTADSLLARAGEDGVPGRGDPLYSNYGAAVLGHALAASQGTGYGALLTERVLGPLGMTATVVLDEGDDLPQGRAAGGAASGVPRSPWLAEAWQPAGIGTWSTAQDLARLLVGVLDGTAPGVAAVEPLADLDGDRVGLFWITSEHGGRTLTWHDGATGGSTAFVGVDRDSGVGLVLLSDTDTATTAGALDLLAELAAEAEAGR